MTDAPQTRRPAWPWIVTLLVGVPLLYVASIPPLAWAVARDWFPPGTYRSGFVDAYTYPIDAVYDLSPPRVQDAIRWYAGLLDDQ